jgi:cytochrome c553
MKKAMHSRSILVAILLGLASSLVQAVGLTQPVQEYERAVLFPSTALIDQGRNVAQIACAGCHGMNGIGDNDGTPQLAGQRGVYLYRVLRAYLDGTRPDETNSHKSFLKDEAVLAVSAYYSNLAVIPHTETADATDPTEMLEEDTFLTIRDAMSKCVKCHGETGNASRAGMPSLTSQDPEYFVTSMMSYVDGSRNHRLMGKLVGDLDEDTIREMGVFYAVQEPAQTQNPGEGDLNVGRRLSEPCASCHGADGNASQASMPSLAGQDAKYFIKAMKHYKDGSRQHKKMFEAVESLSEQEMIDLATYYASQEPARRNVRAPLKSTEWIARCARCHGIDGNSSDPRFPMLAGQDESYLVKVIKSYAAGEWDETTMHAMADPLSRMDIERIAAYFASQQPKAVVYIQLPCGDDQ